MENLRGSSSRREFRLAAFYFQRSLCVLEGRQRRSLHVASLVGGHSSPLEGLWGLGYGV